MYCTKCGTENKDESKFCNNCGAPFENNSEENNANNKVNFGYKKSMFSAFLLNIIAFTLPFLLIVFMQVSSSTTDSSESSGGFSVSFGAEYSSLCLGIAMIIGVLIFIVGMLIYFIKKPGIQKLLSMIYLISAISDLALLVVTCLAIIPATCGLGVILYIPGILQIIAGSKFVSATKFYE